MDLGFMQGWRRLPTVAFHAAGQEEAAALLLDCLRAGEPVVVMTGATGVGKTTTLNACLSRLGDSEVRVLRLAVPFPTAPGLHRQLAAVLGFREPDAVTPAELAGAIAGLPETASGAASLAMVVDDAEAVPVALLQYLWLMHSLACRMRPVLQLILVGRDALWRRLADERLNGLRSGVSARLAMQPFSGVEAEAFLRHLIRARGRPAEPEALAEVRRLGAGIPGRMVTLLDAAGAGLPPRSILTVQRVRTVLGVAPAPPARRRAVAWLPRLLAGVPDALSWHGAGAAAIALVLVLGVSQVLGLGARSPRHSELAPDPAAAATPVPDPPVPPIPAQHGGENNATSAPSQPAGPPATEAVGAHEAGQPPETPDFAALQAQLGAAVAMAKGLAAQAGDMMARADINLASLVPPLPAVPASPPPVVPPAAVGIHVQAEYPALDQVAEARARWAVGVLRAAGLEVTDPIAISGRALHAGVGYFSRSDRDAANAVAHALAAAGRPVYVRRLYQRSDPRPRGTIELLFATP